MFLFLLKKEAGSFAFSIILFLSFSPAVDFMEHAVTPLRPYTPDISVISKNNSCSITRELADRIREEEGVEKVYGRSFSYGVTGMYKKQEVKYHLISYEKYQLQWAKDSLLEGDIEKVSDGQGVLAVYSQKRNYEVGEEIYLKTNQGIKKVKIAGLLSDAPFMDRNAEMMIASEKLFYDLTGKNRYTVVDIQLKREGTENTTERIKEMVGHSHTFSDSRMSNQEARGSYYSFLLFVYGFLIIIALISLLNIVNSIAMSVSARLRQYGIMRAIGMEVHQLGIMIAAETFTYLAGGIFLGCAAGLPLNKKIFTLLITSRWGETWRMPGISMGYCNFICFYCHLFSYTENPKNVGYRYHSCFIEKNQL